MRRNPQEIIMLLADTFKQLKTGDLASIKETRDRTGLHYETIQNYTEIIEYIQTSMPKISYEKEHGIRILVQPDLKISRMDELILYLFDSGAFREAMSVEAPIWTSIDIIHEATEKGALVNQSDKYFLTSQGILYGVDLADKREAVLIDPISKYVQEPEERLVEKPFLSISKNGIQQAFIYGKKSLLKNRGRTNPGQLSCCVENTQSFDQEIFIKTNGLVEAS